MLLALKIILSVVLVGAGLVVVSLLVYGEVKLLRMLGAQSKDVPRLPDASWGTAVKGTAAIAGAAAAIVAVWLGLSAL